MSAIPKPKVFAVTFYSQFKRSGEDDGMLPLKIFASKLRAKAYCEEKAKSMMCQHADLFGDSKPLWLNDTEYILTTSDQRYTFKWSIDETDVDDEVEADFRRPEIELENGALRRENVQLRKTLSEVKGRNAAAACYATMWDGGWDYTKEAVIENLHKVRAILEDDHHSGILDEMFADWQKSHNKNSTNLSKGEIC